MPSPVAATHVKATCCSLGPSLESSVLPAYAHAPHAWDSYRNIYTPSHDWIYPSYTAGLTNPILGFNVHPPHWQSRPKKRSKEGAASTQDRLHTGTQPSWGALGG